MKKNDIKNTQIKQGYSNQKEWIPCDERMPEEPFGCLVTVLDYNPFTGEDFPNLYPNFVGWDGERWNNDDGEDIHMEVIAWMPLPKPWKGEKR